MESKLKIVEFDKYCGTCKFKDNSEIQEPCSDCLSITARSDSHKPEYYESTEEKK